MDKKRLLRKLNDARIVLRNKQSSVVNNHSLFASYAGKLEGLTWAINIVNSVEDKK